MSTKSLPEIIKHKASLFFLSGLLTLGVVHNAMSLPTPVQSPLFLTQSASPIVTFAMSMDQELFKKAYNDYSNLNGGDLRPVDLTYRNDFEYYGYYDPAWCYTYVGSGATGYLAPSVAASNHQCTANTAWSGNFMNWATMSRIDIIRAVLYGGKRSTDSTTAPMTILERAYLPRDVHAFVKVYAGLDLNRYTPYSQSTSTGANGSKGLSLCNVSTDDLNSSAQMAGVTVSTPVIKVAKGLWPQWSASEKYQCWDADASTISPATTTLSTAPGGDILAVLNARVSVCVNGLDSSSSRCRSYPNGGTPVFKPAGILQKHGESARIKYALVSGSFKGHLNGGVLRTKASFFGGNPTATAGDDEVNITTGVFNPPTAVKGIVYNLNNMTIGGLEYQFHPLPGPAPWTTTVETKYADCYRWDATPTIAVVKSTNPGNGLKCRDWGNPLSEIYLESLRYLTGLGVATPGFNVNDTADEVVPDAQGTNITIKGLQLTQGSWTDPLTPDQWCATCSIIVLSTGSNSFDGDNLAGSGLPGIGSSVESWTDKLGYEELNVAGSTGFSALKIFAGSTTLGQQQCIAQNLGKLSDLKGICPETPALEGTYNIAGLAYYAKTTDLRPTAAYPGDQTITTYTIDLAESLPSFKLKVGSNNITFLPACESGSWNVGTSVFTTGSICSLTDVRVETLFDHTSSSGVQDAGSFLFFWEDSIWGNDYDLDAVQRVHWCVGTGCAASPGANVLKLTSSVPYARAGKALRFGYTVSGSTSDGVLPFTDWSVRAGGMDYTSPLSAITLAAAYAKPTSLGSTAAIIADWNNTIKSKTFSAGTGLGILLKKPLYYAAKYGGFTDSETVGNKKPDVASEWDSDGDQVPDNYFSVSNPAELESSLNLVLSSIIGRAASASSAAVSSSRLSQGSFVYQARFSSTNWNGELVAYTIGNGGVIGATPSLTTGTTFPTTPTGRTIYTNGLTTTNGTSVALFTWANLTPTQQYYLAGKTYVTGAPALTASEIDNAKYRLNWITGDAALETPQLPPLPTLRDRTKKNADGVFVHNVLGDIVDSSPVYDGGNDMHYDLLSNALGGDTYANFLQLKKAKTPRIFVGSNDGMIHAFNANTLAYLFSYIPDGVYSKLANLTKPDYGTAANPHQYLMNGQITIDDAYFNGSWHTVLVAALGAGGKEVFALDITDHAAAPKLLFDFEYHATAAQNLTTGIVPSVGYVMGRPYVVPLGNGRFAAVFGNGYESGNGVTPTKSTLAVVDLFDPTGANTKFIDAPSGSGLSTPELLPNNTGVVEYAYAGDLQGNLTKFNLSSATPGSWSSSLMFVAKDGGNNVQPISAPPTLGRNALKNDQIMVYIGTGKYFESGDTNVPPTPKHSMYAILDDGTTVARSSLYQKSINETPTTRTITGDNSVTWGTKSGWYLDFDTTAGERVTLKPLLLYDRLIFPTLIPNSIACGTGGSSWLMQVTAVGDKSLGNYLLNAITKSDYLILGDLAFGIIPSLADTGKLIKSTSEGKLDSNNIALPPNSLGRMNWRQLD